MIKKRIINKPFWIEILEVKKIFKLFGKNNIKIVGGAVRHVLNGQHTNDIDLAVNVAPEIVKGILKKNNISYVDLSKGHGTVSLKTKTYKIEITSLRKDEITYGRKAKVSFTNNFTLDAQRRDFTINAIYSDYEGILFDPFNGCTDLKNKKVKFIGQPEERISEDYLRMLRYFRFIAIYNNNNKNLDAGSLNACIKKFSYIKNLAKERINIEFSKLLISKYASYSLILMKKNNLLNFIIKGLQNLKITELDLIKKLPQCKLIRTSFLFFNTNLDFEELKISLKKSNNEINMIKKICTNKKLINKLKDAKKLKYTLGDEVALKNYILVCCINKKKVNKKIVNILNTWEIPSLPVNGFDIIKFKGIKKENIKNILANLEEWWINNSFRPNKSQCISKIEELVSSNTLGEA